MKDSFDVYFQVLADQGDKDYKAFYDRVRSNPESHVYYSVKEAIELMKKERVVIHLTDNMLSYHYVSHPQEQAIEVFAHGHPEFKGPIVPKNSPLQPILSLAFRHLFERGAVDRIFNLNSGPPLQPAIPETLVLAPGHVILVFLVIFGFVVLSLLCLMGEILYKKWHKKLADKKRKVSKDFRDFVVVLKGSKSIMRAWRNQKIKRQLMKNIEKRNSNPYL